MIIQARIAPGYNQPSAFVLRSGNIGYNLGSGQGKRIQLMPV